MTTFVHFMLSLFPKTIATYQSVYNGEVKVIEQFGQRKIVAGGLLQSGSIIKQLWQKPLNSLRFNKGLPLKVLILGFGGGTAVKIILHKYPQAIITGIEIDPVMIQIYQQFFEESEHSQIKLIQADCFHWIKICTHKYDLILVDLYQGNNIPQQLYTKEFIRKVKEVLKPNGTLIINHLFFGKFQKNVSMLINTFESQFANIKLVRNLSNIFLLANI